MNNLSYKELRSGVWDSEDWRKKRNLMLHEWLQDNNAVRFYLDLSHFVEIFDDFVDRDVEVSNRDMSYALLSALYYIPSNPFFMAHHQTLLPIIFTCANAWLDSNEMATGDESDKAVAYTLKGLGVDLLLTCISITRGVDYMRLVSVDVRRAFMSHQTFSDYCKETS